MGWGVDDSGGGGECMRVYTRFVGVRRCDLLWPVMAGRRPDQMFPNLFPPQFGLQFRGFSVIRGALRRFWI